MQRPVIASDSGGQRETVLTPESVGLDRDTGFAVGAGDATALADAMGAMIDLGADERAAMGARGRVNVLARFSLPTMTAATLAIYARLLAPATA